MSEMIERVAKALYDNMCLANPHVMVTWEALQLDLKSYYSELARAAIEAMREPTDEMWAACEQAKADFEAGIAWPVMIDAAVGHPH